MVDVGPMDFPHVPLDTLTAMNNDPLPASRHAEAERLLASALKALSELDNEIERLETTLSSLKAQRPRDLAKIDLYRSAIAPQRRVPPELLSEIFLKCEPGEIAVPIQPRKIPWVLGRVCSKWRRISIATLGLWTDVGIYPGVEKNAASQKDAVKCVLGRSRPMPLTSITLKINNNLLSLRQLIAPHVSRICNLTLIGTSASIAPLLSFSPDLFISLETLAVHVEVIGLPTEPITMVAGATNLRKLRWNVYCPYSGLLHFPWHNLTHVIMTDDNPFHSNVALVILRQCASLIECSLSLSHHENFVDSESLAIGEHLASDVGGARICVPQLEVLKVSHVYSGPGRPDKFLPHLELPKLRHFEVHTNTYTSWDPASTTTSADLRYLLERAEELVQVHLGWRGGEPITDEMLRLIGHGAILPKLEILRCVLRDDDRTLAKYLDMIEERRTAAASPAVTDFVEVELKIGVYQRSGNAEGLLGRADRLHDERRRVNAYYLEMP
ncbi:hypothetical protein Hypma_006420 [Hypsizygus marmoreus]|uniref:F-box domain-containing protein n=1 Tax=Hypsizygus marmoreus TaxID=39966 RepID=A0A369K305_HYPMA|nr:hypothetical protein Hypma_006420 [Hypsizygus marmoreus]